MEIVIQVRNLEAVETALGLEADGIAAPLPEAAGKEWRSGAAALRAAARRHGVSFYLDWDRLVVEGAQPQARESLAAITELAPDGLRIRDLGIFREARRRYPGLRLQTAAGWGCQNSLGLRVAETLGCNRVVLGGPTELKEVALMMRESPLALEVVLPPACGGFPGLCLLPDYLGVDCDSCPGPGQPEESRAGAWIAALERLPALAQLGVAAVQIRGAVSRETLSQLMELYRMVLAAPIRDRAKILAAAREVLTAFGERFEPVASDPEKPPGTALRGEHPGKGRAPVSPVRPRRESSQKRSRTWLETRGYAEAAVLAREWPGPMVVPLTPANYGAFLPELRRWGPGKRLIWRLPRVIRQAAIGFHRQAVATLRTAGYRRFVASDWGAAVLVHDLGGEVYGDETLGVRNLWALEAGQTLGVRHFCLPPGPKPDSWQLLVEGAPPGSFWGYFYHTPPLSVYSGTGGAFPAKVPGGLAGQRLRWVQEEDLFCLRPAAPVSLERFRDWLEDRGISPLLWALPGSGLAWGQVPEKLRRGPGDRIEKRTPLSGRKKPQGGEKLPK